jgi:hypothetical protein
VERINGPQGFERRPRDDPDDGVGFRDEDHDIARRPT